MQDARNDAKNEESDMDRRKKNIIIHGAEEIGSNNKEVKTKDSEFVKEVLTKLGVECQAKSITRLGEIKERRMQPLKIMMKSVEDKSKVMSNLKGD